MEIKEHENGPWYVENGSMLNKYGNSMLDEDIAILVTIGSDGYGCFHKVGKSQPLLEYMQKATSKLIAAGFEEEAKEWKMITFNIKNDEFNFHPDGYNLDIDEVCTLVNWFNNCIGEQMPEFLSLSLDDMKVKLAKLRRIGF